MSYDESKAAKDTLIGWGNTVRHLWVKMCEEDGMNPAASFVVFSADNKYKQFYDAARREYRETLQIVSQGPGGGYVGLVMEQGAGRRVDSGVRGEVRKRNKRR